MKVRHGPTIGVILNVGVSVKTNIGHGGSEDDGGNDGVLNRLSSRVSTIVWHDGARHVDVRKCGVANHNCTVPDMR